MTDQKVYTIPELIELYKNNELPQDVKVFKYQSSKGEYWIHLDELKQEVVLAGSYLASNRNKNKIG